MSPAGINLGNVKQNNRSAILRLLNDRGAMSRKDIATVLGLTAATVSLICGDMLASGILHEVGELSEAPRAGRKKILLDLNYAYRSVLTICIEASETVLAICDLAGNCLQSRALPTDTHLEPEQFLADIAAACKAFMWENGVRREQVLGVGVSVPGKVDRQNCVSHFAYRVWERPVEIGRCLRQSLELPVLVDNNVRSFAQAELTYGKGKENENLLFLKWGPGVGSALVIHKQIYDSNLAREAQLGHIIVAPGGRLCRCGRRGCLETLVSTHAIAGAVREKCTPQAMPVLWRKVGGDTAQITARDIAKWSGAADKGLQGVLEAALLQLSRTVCGAISMLMPDKVIVYGEMFGLPHFYEKFMAFCQQYDAAFNPEYISVSALSGKLSYIGPLALVVNELFLSGGSNE